MPLFTFRTIRIYILTAILLLSAIYTVHQLLYSRNWATPLDVVIYPLNADGARSTQHYIDNLSIKHFSYIDQWFEREASRYDLLNPRPVKVALGKQVGELPPQLPQRDHPVLNLLWGINLRWWAYWNTPDSQSNWSRVRVFVLYHSDIGKPLPHSLGLQKGLLGIVNAYALSQQNKQNNVVIAHEVLHTVGAVDKYRSDGNPIYPVGYANPNRQPVHPQRNAEIMAGRVPTSLTKSYMAKSLKSTVISPHTAREINWIK